MFGTGPIGNFLGLNNKDGGMVSNGKRVPGYKDGGYASRRDMGYSMGGVARGPRAGYPAMLHGTEAVVPLPRGREIPVEMKGSMGQINNINISVNVDKEGNEDVNADKKEGEGLAKAISSAVKNEIMNQKRNGGMLSPFGVA
jgi:hypothetical protein